MYEDGRHYGEMPTAGARVVLATTTLGTLACAAWWVSGGGGGVEGRDPALVFSLCLLFVSQWVVLGLLLRPRGRGLREFPGRRRLAYGFGVSHVALGVLNVCFPMLVSGPRSRFPDTGPWGASILLIAMGALIGGAAWQAGRADARRPDPGRVGL